MARYSPSVGTSATLDARSKPWGCPWLGFGIWACASAKAGPPSMLCPSPCRGPGAAPNMLCSKACAAAQLGPPWFHP